MSEWEGGGGYLPALLHKNALKMHQVERKKKN